MARSLRKVVRTCKVAFAVLLVGTATGWSEETSDLDAIAGHLVPEKVAKALVGIPDESRKLLALRRVLSDQFERVSARTVRLILMPRRDRATRQEQRHG